MPFASSRLSRESGFALLTSIQHVPLHVVLSAAFLRSIAAYQGWRSLGRIEGTEAHRRLSTTIG
ncbi:hypothetical protein C496_17337 [Natronorubrum tibetense GA33]|uniref:Uncharacterized protein n=1 Tax=Natronorubrum tibetense GA33 TaxID=1114856 RepID=L9VQ94_9EURY|nr:hypothetical protein C496_17337 [Natronorubrum tibetense GA33]